VGCRLSTRPTQRAVRGQWEQKEQTCIFCRLFIPAHALARIAKAGSRGPLRALLKNLLGGLVGGAQCVCERASVGMPSGALVGWELNRKYSHYGGNFDR
jgi:hypothetical protein